MRDAIERAAANNARRQQRLDALQPQGRATGGDVLAQLLTFGQQGKLDRQREELEPQLQDLDRQRRAELASKLGGVNPENFSTAQLQGFRGKQIEQGFKPSKLSAFDSKLVAAGIAPNSPEAREFARKDLEGKPLVTIEGDKESSREKEREKRRSGIITSVFDKAEQSRGTLDQAQVIEDNLNALVSQGGTTGPAFGFLNVLNDFAAQTGLDINLDESSSTTAIEAASNKLAIPLTKQLGVNPTDKDFAIIKSTVARAGTSMPANFAFVDLTKQAANRDIAEESLILNLDESNKSEAEIRKARSVFRRNNPLKPAIPAPRNPEDFEVGRRYTTPTGIWEFDGTKMVRVR